MQGRPQPEKYVGQPLERVEDAALLTGRGRYADDVNLDGQAYAYPIKFLNFHELVNDLIDGIPVLITYCPLCASGVVFDRRVDGEVLVFGNTSALYNSDLVMFDHASGS